MSISGSFDSDGFHVSLPEIQLRALTDAPLCLDISIVRELTSSRVAIVSSFISRQAGGMFESVRRLSQSISTSKDFETVPFAIWDRNTNEDIGEWKPLVPRISMSIGPRRLAYGPSLPSKLRDFNPQLIHAHGIWQYPIWAVNRHHIRFNTPVIVSPRGMLDEWALQNSPKIKRLALFLFQRNQLLNNVACIHALCESEAVSIRKFGCRAPIAIIPNAADRNAKVDLPIRMGRATRPYLLFISRSHPKKGIFDLIRAWSKTSTNNEKQIQLVIAGDGESPFRNKMIRLIRSLGCQLSCSINDWTDESSIVVVGDVRGETKKSLFAHCDGFVLSSLSEGLPVSVLEAWSYGKPVLMTRACNIPEGFSSGAAIEISTDKSLEIGIGQSLHEFASLSLEQRQAMGDRGLELIDSKFNWKNAGDQMADVYRWLLGTGERPKCIHLD